MKYSRVYQLMYRNLLRVNAVFNERKTNIEDIQNHAQKDIYVQSHYTCTRFYTHAHFKHSQTISYTLT